MDEKAPEVLRIEIARLDVQPGETLLVRVPEAHLMNAERYIREAVPRGVKVLVAPFEAEFSVISAAE
jgi:hypothetical protein